MDFRRMYAISDACNDVALCVRPARSDAPWGSWKRGEGLPAQPVVFNHRRGRIVYDLISWDASVFMLHDRIIDRFHARAFTGWTTFPVEIYGKDRKRVDQYKGFAVTGRCGPIIDSLSKPRIAMPLTPGGCKMQLWYGMYFDEATWDGSDFVIPEGTHIIVVTDPVKEVLEALKATNIAIEPMSERENTRVPGNVVD